MCNHWRFIVINVNARQARVRLSDLLTEAEHGETITITRRGRVLTVGQDQ